MPTSELLHGLSGNLQSSTSWEQQEAIEQIRQNLTQALSDLTPDEQKRYVQLQRESLTALSAVETEKDRLVQASRDKPE